MCYASFLPLRNCMLDEDTARKARARIKSVFVSQEISDQILRIEEDLKKGEIYFFLKSRVRIGRERKMIFRLDTNGNTISVGRES